MLKKLVFILFLTGCSSFWIPEEARTTARNNADKCNTFQLFMEFGKTTRTQEQAFIKAMRRAWHAQNFALNDVPLPPDVEEWQANFKPGINDSLLLIDTAPVSSR